jgi:hypothetical protein
MGFSSDYELNPTILSLLACVHYCLTFSPSSNQNSYDPRFSMTEYPVILLAVNMFIGVGGNDLMTQISTGLGLGNQHYFTNRSLENHYEQSAALNKNKITMGND